MSRSSKNSKNDLATLYALHEEQHAKKFGPLSIGPAKERSRQLNKLKARGIVTVDDLLSQLPSLPPKLKTFGVDVISALQPRDGVAVLLDVMSDRAVRATCAFKLGYMKRNAKAVNRFVEIGLRELSAEDPDRFWLEAVILGLAPSDDPRATEILVTIFERTDLPDWVRGDAGDKLGRNSMVNDRRKRLFRRCRDAALRGLNEESIEVQFWSMYVIGSLVGDGRGREKLSSSNPFKVALKRLREIAANDHRLAPGYWWPMSAEAEDIIYCIENGCWPENDASERCDIQGERGVWNRD